MINAIQTIGGALSVVKDIASTSSSSGSLAASATASVSGAPKSQSFADVMSSMATEMSNTLRQSETLSIQGMRGEANTREVVDAVMNAEQSLQTAVAIRDKVVSAYLEIARMPI